MFNKTLMNLKYEPLRSEEGSVLLSALIISAIIAIFGGVIASRIQSTDKLTHLPRIRAAMAQIEVQMRIAAFSPASYTCVYGTGAAYAAGYRCDVNVDVFSKLKAEVDDGVVNIDPASLTVDASRFFHGNIRFEPNNLADPRVQIAIREVEVEVPSEVLQSVNFQCPPDRPLFAGYSDGTGGNGPAGAAICHALPTNECAAGEFISSIDPVTLVPTCSRAGSAVSCPTDQYISHFEWNNASRVDFRCLPRKNPFTEMGYDLSIALTVDPFFLSTAPAVPNPTPPPLPTPEVITWTAPNPQPASICYSASAVNCAGSFGTCSAACGGGTQIYTITTAAANGGAVCPYTTGAIMPCNTQACATPTPGPVAGGCLDSVFYKPCRSTACNTDDLTCPTGQVIDRFRTGNVWTGPSGSGILLDWVGPGGTPTNLCIPAGTGTCASAPTPSPTTCPAGSVNWTVGAATCTGTTNAGNAGDTINARDESRPNTGIGQLTCASGAWVSGGGSTCSDAFGPLLARSAWYFSSRAQSAMCTGTGVNDVTRAIGNNGACPATAMRLTYSPAGAPTNRTCLGNGVRWCIDCAPGSNNAIGICLRDLEAEANGPPL